MRSEFDSLPTPDYGRDSGWLSLPARPDSPVDLFYLHPTVAAGPAWFGDPSDETMDAAATRVASADVRAFPGLVWAPRYRQASGRAFREIAGDGARAYDESLGDVERAFDVFADRTGDRPFVLAGHSQGARHVLSLLAGRIAGTPTADRLVAAYAVGVGVAVRGFAERFPGLALTGAAGRPGCVISWNTFLDGADSSALLGRTAGPIACVNPLTFDPDESDAGPERHLRGTADTDAPRVGARVRAGVLHVTPVVEGSLADAALPGGALHPVDITLFHENIRADAEQRVSAHRDGRR